MTTRASPSGAHRRSTDGVSDEESGPPSVLDAATDGGSTARVRVLLVEDDEVDRMAFRRAIDRRRLPFDAVIVASLEEARAELASQSVDVILTDYHLGDGCGLELMELPHDLPVVVITGAGDEETAVEAMRAGASDYLIKDLERRYLRVVPAAIEHARRHHQASRRARILGQAVTSLNDAIFVTDLHGRLVYVNETFLELYRCEETSMLGTPAEGLWVESRHHELLPSSPELLPAAGEKGECWHRRADGSHFAAYLSRSPIWDERGKRVATVGAVRDVSERRRWEDALRESEERYALAAAAANDGLWDWDLRTGRVYYSSRWRATLGYGETEIRDDIDAWFELVHVDDLALLKAQIAAHIEGRTPHFENEHRIRTRDGELRWVQVRGLAVRTPPEAGAEDPLDPGLAKDQPMGRVHRMAGSQRDITDRKRAEEQLIHAALHDPLTGLPNRALFLDRLENAFARGTRSDHHFAVLFLDLDRFKMINDSLGHQAGDRLLEAIAERLRQSLRLGDTVARLGGDEFGILLEDLDGFEQVDEVADRLLLDLRAPLEVDGHECFPGASLGIALSSGGYQAAQDLLRDADIAMYRAKAEGRTRHVIFQPHMHMQAVAALSLESDLQRALERDELEVHFQPIVSLADGRLSAFESLVRWRHPKRGLVMPDQFLPLAQESDLSEDIGWWVLEESCRRLVEWRARGPFEHVVPDGLAVSVNLDGRQLASPALVERVESILEATGLDPRRLRLEITESMIIHDPARTAETLHRLRRDGVHLHIDDFGTGYSSLGQLKTLPVDSLKVDRSFVARMLDEGEDYEIVRSITQLAHNLRLEVMVEGIETVEQLQRVRELGCDFGQGFLFARALDSAAVLALLGRGARFAGFEPVAESPRAGCGRDPVDTGQ